MRYDERGGTKAHSNAAGGMWTRRDLWARMGKVAPNEPVTQMMKTEAIRRPVKVVAPPPEPQLSEDMSRAERTLFGKEKRPGRHGWVGRYIT